MSAPTKDGGPAFPRSHDADEHNGLSLRDYFAAKAMQALMTAHDASGMWFGNEPDHVPAHAYRMADAMLAAREVKP